MVYSTKPVNSTPKYTEPYCFYPSNQAIEMFNPYHCPTSRYSSPLHTSSHFNNSDNLYMAGVWGQPHRRVDNDWTTFNMDENTYKYQRLPQNNYDMVLDYSQNGLDQHCSLNTENALGTKNLPKEVAGLASHDLNTSSCLDTTCREHVSCSQKSTDPISVAIDACYTPPNDFHTTSTNNNFSPQCHNSGLNSGNGTMKRLSPTLSPENGVPVDCSNSVTDSGRLIGSGFALSPDFNNYEHNLCHYMNPNVYPGLSPTSDEDNAIHNSCSQFGFSRYNNEHQLNALLYPFSEPTTTQPQSFEWSKKQTCRIASSVGKTRTKDKYRVVYSDTQRLELEKEFHFSRYITIRRKTELSLRLCLSERQVKIWFQNRRAKERKLNRKRDEVVMVAGVTIEDTVPTLDESLSTQLLTVKQSDEDLLYVHRSNSPSLQLGDTRQIDNAQLHVCSIIRSLTDC